jgi:hypothetical protein
VKKKERIKDGLPSSSIINRVDGGTENRDRRTSVMSSSFGLLESEV